MFKLKQSHCFNALWIISSKPVTNISIIIFIIFSHGRQIRSQLGWSLNMQVVPWDGLEEHVAFQRIEPTHFLTSQSLCEVQTLWKQRQNNTIEPNGTLYSLEMIQLENKIYYQQPLHQIFSFREELLRKFVLQLYNLLENQVLVPIKTQMESTSWVQSISSEGIIAVSLSSAREFLLGDRRAHLHLCVYKVFHF